MVDVLADFPLQPYVERLESRYFAESAVDTGEALNLALRSPFAKLYSLSRHPKQLTMARQRYELNDRIHIFRWSHPLSWTEVVRLVPIEAPAVFWLHATENVGRCLGEIARLRPYRRDLVIIENSEQGGVRVRAERLFGRTHRICDMGESLKSLQPRNL